MTNDFVVQTNHGLISILLFSMATKTATRFSIKTDTSVFKRLGRKNQENVATNHQVRSAVCKYWLEGRCTRNPCRFLHPEQPVSVKSDYASKNPYSYKLRNSPPNGKTQPKLVKNKENCDQNLVAPKIKQSEVNVGESKSIEKTDAGIEEKKCHNVLSWFDDKRLTRIAHLEGHSKV